MPHSFPEREFSEKGFSRVALEWLRTVDTVVTPGTISLDVTELEALQHEFRLLRNELDQLKDKTQENEIRLQFNKQEDKEEFINGLPDHVVQDLMKNVVIIDPVNGEAAYVNSASNRLKVEGIDYAHSQVHAGDFYTVSRIENSVASASSLEFFIITGATYKLHMTVNAGFGGDSELYVYEDTTVSSNGTGLTAYNNNRSSANTAEASFYYAPTITGVGTNLYQDFLAGGSGVFGGGGSDGGPIRSGTEIILDVSTNYLIRLTNTSGGAVDLSLALGFYEDT